MTPVDAQFPPRPTSLVQEILRPLIVTGDHVIDATAGNGHDTVFLAACVGESGRVLAFDIQQAALNSARARVAAEGFSERVEFIRESHAAMADHAETASQAVVMFNLGYLPGEDHAVTTECGETLMALSAAAGLLAPGGGLSVVCYPGHPAGAVEADAVEEWMLGQAGRGWRVAKYGALGTRKPAPFVLVIRKGS